MSYISKPKVSHPKSKKNNIGLKRRDYEGVVSTLCAGCGHDSITAALIQAVYELAIEPHRLAKVSGIGCSSKTPAYFCLLYTSPSPRDGLLSRMPSSA